MCVCVCVGSVGMGLSLQDQHKWNCIDSVNCRVGAWCGIVFIKGGVCTTGSIHIFFAATSEIIFRHQQLRSYVREDVLSSVFANDPF